MNQKDKKMQYQPFSYFLKHLHFEFIIAWCHDASNVIMILLALGSIINIILLALICWNYFYKYFRWAKYAILYVKQALIIFYSKLKIILIFLKILLNFSISGERKKCRYQACMEINLKKTISMEFYYLANIVKKHLRNHQI